MQWDINDGVKILDLVTGEIVCEMNEIHGIFIARLVAAAPDLLHALNNAMDEIDLDRNDGIEPPEWYALAKECFSQIYG